MTASLSSTTRTHLKHLKDDSQWVILACVNLGYGPLLFFLLANVQIPPGGPPSDFLLWLAGWWWLVSLAMLALIAVVHSRLRYHLLEAVEASTEPPADRAQLKRFASYRTGAAINLGTGFTIPLVVSLATDSHGPDNWLGLASLSAVVMLFSWLPASLFWLTTARSDFTAARRATAER